jgi:hypothetical protein
LKTLDSGFRRNDGKTSFQTFYEIITIDEHHFGIMPLHTKVSQRLLREIRPQVESGFENDKNKL